ncbi:ABC transporter permease [Aeoliella sp. SH292]|uniref:ABC transporter permease n=1 Tax=Aeoliella sp. SH292 TaxID=3454464 RepID=UPI003F9BF07F
MIPSTGPKPETPRIGKSLWSDAWDKLRRNRLAVTCLSVLVLVALGAFLTPLLPLQPSDKTVTTRDFAPPQFTHDPTDDLTLTLDQIREANEKAASLAATRKDIPAEDADALKQLNDSIHDVRQRPYRAAGFTDMGPLSRWMTRVRISLFGEWSIPSICGRDSLGRDVLARIFWGARVSIIVSIVATLVSLVIGVSYGAISGYFGGTVDAVMMRFVDVLYSVPFIFVVIFLLTILGEEQTKKQLAEYGIDRITIFYLVVGAIYWLTMARVVRGQVLSLKKELFVEAARAQGASQWRIIKWHVVPNVMSVVIVYLTLTIPRVMLFEAFLSFLGLGVESPDVSWGMLASEGLDVINPVRTYWWLVVFPSIAIGMTLFALNFFGDSLRDALDPKLREGR